MNNILSHFLVALIPSLLILYICPSVFSDSLGTEDYSAPFVAQIQKEIEDSLSEGITEGSGVFTLWQTPIYKFNIKKQGVNVTELNSKLAASILYHFNQFQEHNPGLKKNGYEETGANQAFFEWQKTGGFSVFEKNTEIQQIQQFANYHIDSFLSILGKSEEELAQRKRTLFTWATIHDGGINHLSHLHEESIISGVYYVLMPQDSGKIIFEDPRGPYFPFDNKFSISPKEGDLILFPSWLIHQVSPTYGKSPRISIAFNAVGEWEATTNLKNFVTLM